MPEGLELGFYIAVALVAFFLLKKRKARPTKLDLTGFKGQENKFPALGNIRKVEAEVVDEAPDKDKGTVFMYKATKYDALKVLNVPLGASPKEVKKAYSAKLLSSPEDTELLVKAYEVLISAN